MPGSPSQPPGMDKMQKLTEEVGTLKHRLSEEIIARCSSQDLVESLRRQLSTKIYELAAKDNALTMKHNENEELLEERSKLEIENEAAHKKIRELSQRLAFLEVQNKGLTVKAKELDLLKSREPEPANGWIVQGSKLLGVNSSANSLNAMSPSPMRLAPPRTDKRRMSLDSGMQGAGAELTFYKMGVATQAVQDTSSKVRAAVGAIGAVMTFKKPPPGAMEPTSLTITPNVAPMPAIRVQAGEREVADILVVGTNTEELVTHLARLNHKVSHVAATEISSSISRLAFDAIVLDTTTYGDFSTPASPFIGNLKKHQPHGILLTWRTDGEFKDAIRQIDYASNGHRATLLQELVHCQTAIFVQQAWVGRNHNPTPTEVEQQMKEREAEHLISQALLEESVKEARQLKKKLEGENAELSRIVSGLVSEKVALDDEIENQKEKISQLYSKMYLLEFEKEMALTMPREQIEGVSDDVTRKLGAGIVVSGFTQEEARVTSPIGGLVRRPGETPVQTVVRVLVLLLRDDRYVDVRPFLEETLRTLAGSSLSSLDVEESMHKSGVDAVTKDWMIFEYSRNGQLKSTAGPQRMIAGAATYEKPIELPQLDSSVLETWGCDPLLMSFDEMIAHYVDMLENLGLIKYFSVPRNNLIRFLRQVSTVYRKNPYHTFIHAFDVAQMCYKIVHNTKAKELLSELDLFSLMVAAICHDLDHPGTNNNFLINDSAPLAMIYNDQSPLENHHASRAFYITASAETNVFGGMTGTTYTAARRSIISAILNTDMNNHFDLLNKFNAHMATHSFADRSPESRQLLINMILHLSDISNVCRPFDLSKKWSDLVIAEFFYQGDLEKQKGMTVSPLMDRNNTDQNKMSVGFIDFIVMPGVTALGKVIPEVNELAQNLTTNKAIWQERAGGPPAPVPSSTGGSATDLKVTPVTQPLLRGNSTHNPDHRRINGETESSRDLRGPVGGATSPTPTHSLTPVGGATSHASGSGSSSNPLASSGGRASPGAVPVGTTAAGGPAARPLAAPVAQRPGLPASVHAVVVPSSPQVARAGSPRSSRPDSPHARPGSPAGQGPTRGSPSPGLPMANPRSVANDPLPSIHPPRLVANDTSFSPRRQSLSSGEASSAPRIAEPSVARDSLATPGQKLRIEKSVHNLPTSMPHMPHGSGGLSPDGKAEHSQPRHALSLSPTTTAPPPTFFNSSNETKSEFIVKRGMTS
eukprot:TRINITY_DN30795_c0_g1_i1.p1 TRINITY_DN30795_c0_g1~~TRINITY_DN30795_c0_g1_i1.p1  ORF type:complete len:1211 (+),score=461.31 TRINITY_DN30795_c0_g1_i1:111-3743(+)